MTGGPGYYVLEPTASEDLQIKIFNIIERISTYCDLLQYDACVWFLAHRHQQLLSTCEMLHIVLCFLVQKDLLQEDCQRMELCIEEQKKEIDQLHRENEILQNKFRHIQSVLGTA